MMRDLLLFFAQDILILCAALLVALLRKKETPVGAWIARVWRVTDQR